MALIQITVTNRGRGANIVETYAKKLLFNTERFINWKANGTGCDFFYQGMTDGGVLAQISYRTALSKAGVEALLGESVNASFIDIPVTGVTQANWSAAETHGVTTDKIIIGYDNDAGTDSFLWIASESGKALKAKSSLTISEIDNLALAVVPISYSVAVTGTAQDTEVLTGVYSYYDADGSAESGSIFAWYIATAADGTGDTVIGGETSITYTVVTGDVGKFIRFVVTPKNAVDTGVATTSVYTTVVLA